MNNIILIGMPGAGKSTVGVVSFLLHSYYSYRHLLLARKTVNDGTEYVLCAPGICQNREEFMASMFGFCDFKPVRRVKDKKGEFGYWYMPVMV